MPKKSSTARSTKVKAQKSFELVRPALPEQNPEVEDAIEETEIDNISPVATIEAEPEAVVSKEKEVSTVIAAAPLKGSASARLAARRITTQRPVQRSAPALINSEHFAYVRKDLIFITVLALIMFAAIIVSYFLLGRGA